MLNKIFKFASKVSRWLLPVVGVFLIFVLFSHPTLAANEPLKKTLSDLTASGIMQLFSFIIIIITLIAYVFALIVGDLIDSTYILDTGMGDTLHLIWSVMRNFVNVGFILILLVVAAMVIFGGSNDKYGLGMLKKVLPKFIIALVAVNLTFFAGRFILTTNDVLATAIFTLPKVVAGDKMIKLPCKPGLSIDECMKAVAETVDLKGSLDPNASSDTKTRAAQKIKELRKNMSEHKVADMVNKKSIMLVLLTSMLDLGSLVQTKGVVGDGWDMAISGIMSMVTAGAIAIVIFMLVIALVIRMVVLWICFAISPVAALMMVLGDIVPGAKPSGDLDLMSVFIKHAFMPTLVAIPLSIGLIMIFANNTVGFDYQRSSLFSLSDAAHAGNFNSLLWWIASIAIIWIGTNEAIKKSSKWAGQATEKIHNGVNKFVGGVAGTLKYAPIMPTWAGGSVAGIGRQAELFQSHFREQSEKRALATAQRYRYGGEASAADSKINQFTMSPSAPSLKKNILEDPAAAKRLLEGTGSGAEKSRQDFLVAMGYNRDAIERMGQLTPEKFAEALNTKSPDSPQISGYATGSAIQEALKTAANKATTPEAAKKQTAEQTGVASQTAGEKVESGKVSGAQTTNIKINNRPIFKKDDKYYFADDNKDIANGGTVAFTEAELNAHLKDLKFDVKEAKDAKDADALAQRIKKAIDTFGDKATDQLGKLEFANNEVKEALERRLKEQHNLSEDIRKKLGIK
ncbi:MAG: hypothetical protein V2A63_02010 [Patescibacteria group bacterium]